MTVERTFRSFAKINLHLAVEGRRPDGYHELKTVFQTVELHDRIRLRTTPTPGVSLAVPDGGAPADSTNLAHRAARAIFERWAPEGGVEIELHKRIPAGGGLGGGSSNAATVLAGLNELLDMGIPTQRLAEIGAEIGADVPYFLTGGTALGTGRGDRIEPLSEMPEETVWLVDPGVSISTAEIFAALVPPATRPPAAGLERLLAGEPAETIAELGGWNDLEETVLARSPEVRNVYNALRRAGASCVRLSGSGGTVFACFASSGHSEHANSALPAAARVVVTRTLSRSTMARWRIVEAGDRSER